MTASSAPAALEAAARLTWRGAAVVVTVRADDPAILARRLDRALAAFALDVAASMPCPAPVERRPAAAPSSAAPAPRMAHAPAMGAAAPPVCPVHGAPLTWRTPKGGGAGWYSHRTADGGWCRG